MENIGENQPVLDPTKEKKRLFPLPGSELSVTTIEVVRQSIDRFARYFALFLWIHRASLYGRSVYELSAGESSALPGLIALKSGASVVLIENPTANTKFNRLTKIVKLQNVPMSRLTAVKGNMNKLKEKSSLRSADLLLVADITATRNFSRDIMNAYRSFLNNNANCVLMCVYDDDQLNWEVAQVANLLNEFELKINKLFTHDLMEKLKLTDAERVMWFNDGAIIDGVHIFEFSSRTCLTPISFVPPTNQQ